MQELDISINSSTSSTASNNLFLTLKKPETWFAVWVVYVLSALAWMGYKDAMLGFLCLAPR